MILQNKRDRESWYREKTIESLKSNTYLLENDIILVAETNCFYKVIKTTTDIPLQNNLFAEVMTSNIVGNSTSADKLKTPRTISLTGNVSGSTSFDGSINVSIDSTITNDSHTHSNSTITSLDASKITSGTIDIARLPQGALERCIVVSDDSARFKLTSSQVQQGDTVKVTSTNKMYFVVNISKLTTEEGYTVYTAGSATEVPWSGVTGKPNNYPPSSHTHTKGQITDFPTSLKNPTAITIQANGTSLGSYDGSSAKTFNITASNVGASASNHTHTAGAVGAYTKEEVDSKLSGKANTSHGNHVPATQTANNKVFLRNDNTWATITPANIGAQPAGSYAAASHTHPATQITQDATHRFVTDDEKVTWNGKANVHDHPYLPLAGGRLGNNAEIRGTMAENDYWFIRGMGTNDDGYFEIGTGDNGNEPIYVRQYNFDSNNSTHSITLMDANGNQAFNAVNASGTVTCSDCITTSDERLKKDIVKIDNALDKVNQLNGYTFLKDGDGQRTTGVLAQELLNVLPEAVFKREDGYYAVTYGNIVGLLIEAIKELQNEIKVLRGED